MVLAKIKSAYNRNKGYWQRSSQVAQAFYIAKKLKTILGLPRKASLTWEEQGFSLINIKTHRALGIKLLELDQDRSRKRAFKIFDYLLVSRYPTAKTITFLAQDALRLFIAADQKNGKQPGQSKWIDMKDSLLRSEKTPISTEYSLIFTEISPDYRPSPEHVFDWQIKPPSDAEKPKSHPLERIMAFFWTRKNYDLLVQAGIIK